jgi:hypothetical protein
MIGVGPCGHAVKRSTASPTRLVIGFERRISFESLENQLVFKLHSEIQFYPDLGPWFDRCHSLKRVMPSKDGEIKVYD